MGNCCTSLAFLRRVGTKLEETIKRWGSPRSLFFLEAVPAGDHQGMKESSAELLVTCCKHKKLLNLTESVSIFSHFILTHDQEAKPPFPLSWLNEAAMQLGQGLAGAPSPASTSHQGHLS